MLMIRRQRKVQNEDKKVATRCRFKVQNQGKSVKVLQAVQKPQFLPGMLKFRRDTLNLR